MKKPIIKFYLIILLLIIIVFVTACSGFSGTVFWNDEIKQEIINEIHSLNEILVDSMKKNTPESLLELVTEDLAEDNQFQQLIKNGFGEQFAEDEFLNLHNYYILLNKTGNYTYNAFSFDEKAPFYIHVPAKSTEMYVSLMVNEKPLSQLLLALYIKEKGDWKLESFYIGDYAYEGLNALQLYQKAITLYEEGITVPALLYLKASVNLIRPTPILQYKEEAKITDYFDKVKSDVTQMYEFPIHLSNINNEPVLYGLDAMNLMEGIVPVINYITNLNLDEQEAVKEEAYLITTDIDSIFPGVTQNFRYIVFKAFTEAPENPNIYYDTYTTVVDLLQ